MKSARNHTLLSSQEKKKDWAYLDFPDNSREPTDKEKHAMLDKIYSTPHVEANFGLVPGNDIGFDINSSTRIKDVLI